jgi:hypothetical protein
VRELEQVEGGLSLCQLEVWRGPPAEEQDLSGVVDQDTRWRILLDCDTIRLRLQVIQGRRRISDLVCFQSFRQPTGDWKLQRQRRRNDFLGIELVSTVLHRKQGAETADGFGSAQPQDTAGIQGVVKHLDDALLEVRREVNEDIPAGDQVDFGKRRIGREIVS